MNAMPLLKDATYADLLAMPDDVKAELIDGVIYCQSQPSVPHQRLALNLARHLAHHFDHSLDGRDVPGGWIILYEIELHLLGRNVVAPDLAGWRRERMPEVPQAKYIEMVPDWICEVISSSNEQNDRLRKYNLYARAGVPYYWLLNPVERFLEVFKLTGEQYVRIAGGEIGETGTYEPFDAVPLELARLWR